ncbi:NEP1-interacting protein-like 1 [Pyrus ussuriensis x Pyrus communis]|uniref:NEP1-interacting protein-like 1 n=1 Tax=Pyrus ussuriensis x Pyrus communis TaxID=2448454 RepID=A0A5N5GFE0_9ROSA|nr:NEP1-interacting protein-like 1 [Pyrus ussuriensis x Pyrus communis]
MWKYIHLTFTHFSWLFNFLLYRSFSKHYDHYFDEATDISLTTEGEEIRELRCAHLFHKPCLDWWTGFKHANCPICRSRLAPPRSTQLHRQLDEQVEVLVFKFCSFSSDSDRGDRWWLR